VVVAVDEVVDEEAQKQPILKQILIDLLMIKNLMKNQILIQRIAIITILMALKWLITIQIYLLNNKLYLMD
jgi:hypothetical protein